MAKQKVSIFEKGSSNEMHSRVYSIPISRKKIRKPLRLQNIKDQFEKNQINLIILF